jgi:hypothetical protein
MPLMRLEMGVVSHGGRKQLPVVVLPRAACGLAGQLGIDELMQRL